MPKTRYHGYTISTQVAALDEGITYRYSIDRFGKLPTHLTSDFCYTNREEAEAAAKLFIDQKRERKNGPTTDS